jgi:hypothetical protein
LPAFFGGQTNAPSTGNTVDKFWIAVNGYYLLLLLYLGKLNTMSYVYSNGLCRTALTILGGSGDYKERVLRAIAEMGVSKQGDTSEDIYKEWMDIKEDYHQLSKNTNIADYRFSLTDDEKFSLKGIAERLVAVIADWLEWNAGQIAKGTYQSKKKTAVA